MKRLWRFMLMAALLDRNVWLSADVMADQVHLAFYLAAAWLLDRVAGFRIVTLYLAQEPSPELLADLSFREDEPGANAWLVVPNDEGVFHGAAVRDKIRCVHPIQAYLDLQAHPERADEAAQKLRDRHLKWRADD